MTAEWRSDLGLFGGLSRNIKSLSQQARRLIVALYSEPPVLLLVALAAVPLLRELTKVAGASLPPDPIGYRQYAELMKHLYDTDVREPLVVWSVKVCLKFFGRNDLSVRFNTMIFSLLSSITVFFLAKEATRRVSAAWIAFLLSILNPFLLAIAVSGHRDVLVQFGSVLLGYFLVAKPGQMSRGLRLAGLAAAAIICSGTRLNMSVPVFVIILAAMRMNNLRLRDAVWPITAVAIVIGPYLWYCYDRWGDPFFASNAHSVWWRNYEYAHYGNFECNGCPNLVEFETQPYSGPPETAFHYMFGLHPFKQVVAGVLKGIYALMLSPSEFFYRFLGRSGIAYFLLYALGLAELLLRRSRILVLIPLAAMNLVFYSVTTTGMEERLYSPLVPFMLLSVAAGATLLLTAFWKLAAKLSAPRQFETAAAAGNSSDDHLQTAVRKNLAGS